MFPCFGRAPGSFILLRFSIYFSALHICKTNEGHSVHDAQLRWLMWTAVSSVCGSNPPPELSSQSCCDATFFQGRLRAGSQSARGWVVAKAGSDRAVGEGVAITCVAEVVAQTAILRAWKHEQGKDAAVIREKWHSHHVLWEGRNRQREERESRNFQGWCQIFVMSFEELSVSFYRDILRFMKRNCVYWVTGALPSGLLGPGILCMSIKFIAMFLMPVIPNQVAYPTTADTGCCSFDAAFSVLAGASTQ